MRESRDIITPVNGHELSFWSLEEAEALSKEFHSMFPDSKINTIIGPSRGKWQVVFEGDASQDEEITDWINERRST